MSGLRLVEVLRFCDWRDAFRVWLHDTAAAAAPPPPPIA